MTTHSKGPWFVTDDHPQRACLHIRNENRNEIASVYDTFEDHSFEDEHGVWQDDHVRMANARLLAAAPELLDVLEKLAEIDFGAAVYTSDDELKIDKIAFDARQLISKIKGSV